MPSLPPLVLRAVGRLVRGFSPDRIVLFGSHAKGVAHAGSDVDLLVVVNSDKVAASHQRRARQLTADCFPPVDVVLCTREELAEACLARSPFLLSIIGTGITVYTA